MAELGAYAQEIYQASKQAFNQAYRDLDLSVLMKNVLPLAPVIQLIAVMEHTAKGAMLPLAAVGRRGFWQAIWDISDKDEQGNVVFGDAYAEQCW